MPAAMAPNKPEIDIEKANQMLEGKAPGEVIRWAYDIFGTGLGMLSSMQKTASAMMHMMYANGLTDVEIIFVDTQYHFQETLDLRDRFIEDYGLNIKTYYPDKSPEEQFREFGRELYLNDGDYQICCELRKEKPFLKAAEPFHAMLSGLMRSEGGARKNIPVVAVDPRIDGYRVHPLHTWTAETVEEYLRDNNVPVHPLHAQGYPSIGCSTCTTAVKPGEDERAGRWRHIREQRGTDEKLYCGINFTDKK